jgi:hypothetical protein
MILVFFFCLINLKLNRIFFAEKKGGKRRNAENSEPAKANSGSDKANSNSSKHKKQKEAEDTLTPDPSYIIPRGCACECWECRYNVYSSFFLSSFYLFI